MSRPKVYESNAARQRAYRARKKLKEQEEQQKRIESSKRPQLPHHFVWSEWGPIFSARSHYHNVTIEAKTLEAVIEKVETYLHISPVEREWEEARKETSLDGDQFLLARQLRSSEGQLPNINWSDPVRDFRARENLASRRLAERDERERQRQLTPQQRLNRQVRQQRKRKAAQRDYYALLDGWH